MDFEDERITVTEETPKSRPEMREHLSLADQIDAAIKESKGRPWAVNELAEAVDKPEHSIRTILSRYKDRFVKLPDGTWGLAAHE